MYAGQVFRTGEPGVSTVLLPFNMRLMSRASTVHGGSRFI